MSVAKVLKLAEHRDRRHYRLALTRAMLGRDRARRVLIDHLAEVADLTGSDRVAVAWIDEYGPGVVHPHVVLDLLSDRPRRLFSAERLEKAWDFGIPGVLDDLGNAREERTATFAVALGSDGARGWFLVADSVTRQLLVQEGRRDRLMFLAGEISSVVLHADLGRTDDDGGSFAGWQFLKDLEGHESDGERSGIVGRRFEAGRLVVALVEEDLCVPAERRSELAERAWESVSSDDDIGPDERTLLGNMLEAYEDGELTRVATATLDAGRAAERVDHPAGALELYRCAYEVAAALCEPQTAIEAARASGRVLRRRGEWEHANRWYETALEIARRAQIWDLVARTRAGLAVIDKDRGDFEAARSGFESALELADRASDAQDTKASIYQDLMNLEYLAGELPIAARHGWRAVNTCATDGARARCLVAFAWILKELGDLEAAEDAYAVARETCEEHYYSVYAHAGFAHMAALRGDDDAYDRRMAECDALGWEDGPTTSKAEILYFRGLAHSVLGRWEEARTWLERAATFADEHSLDVIRDDAESALEELSGEEARPRTSTSPAPPEVRAGLRAMRDEVAGVVGA